MAVLDGVPGFKAEVFVNGVPLQEFIDSDEETAESTTIKYVEAISGANFEVRYVFDSTFIPKHDVTVRISVDGKKACSHVWEVRQFPISRSFIGAREKFQDKYTIAKFCFSELTIDDSGNRVIGEDMKRKLKDLGTIRLTACWTKVLNKSDPDDCTKLQSELGAVPEKALKGSAISHQASFAAPEPTKKWSTIHTRDVGKGDFATFEFRYRSRNSLKALCLIARSPEPVPLEERDVDSLSPDEMRELLRRQREQSRAARVVKQETLKRERTERSETIGASGEPGTDGDVSFVSAKRRRLPPITINQDGIEVLDLT